MKYVICTITLLTAKIHIYFRPSLSETMQLSGQEKMKIFHMLGKFLASGKKKVNIILQYSSTSLIQTPLFFDWQKLSFIVRY